MIDLLDEHGPAASVRCGSGRGRFGLLGIFGAVWAAGPRPAGPAGVVAVVADGVLALVGDVLEEFGQEVQRLVDMEVAGDAGEQLRAGGVGEALGAILFGPIDDPISNARQWAAQG